MRHGNWWKPSSAATPTLRRSPNARRPPKPRRRWAPFRRKTPERSSSMIEAAKFWNEPNNKSHWDPQVDPGWVKYAEMVKLASAAVQAEAPELTKVLGGISPI